MIPKSATGQVTHAMQILKNPDNQGFLDHELTQILITWLDLEAEVLMCREPAPDIIDWIPSVRLARWVMEKAGCYEH